MHPILIAALAAAAIAALTGHVVPLDVIPPAGL